MQHHRAVLAHRIQHDGAFALGDDLSHDVNAFGFQALQMRQWNDFVRGRVHIHVVAAQVQNGPMPHMSL